MNNKLIYINYLRSTSMLCIVLYHCLCYYTDRWNYISPRIQIYDSIAGMIHGITLPMFVFISGYLYCILRDKGKYTDYSSFLKRKASRLLLPMIIWSIICVIAMPNASWSDLKGGSYKHLWFLGMLFMLFMIAPYLRKIALKSKQGFLWILLFCVCSYLFHKRPLVSILPFPFLDAGCYTFAFFAGIWKGHNTNSNVCKIKKSALFLVGGVYGITYITPPSMSSHVIDNILLLLRLVMSAILCLLIMQKMENVKLKEYAIVKKLSVLSMGIYIVHHILIEELLSLSTIRNFMDGCCWIGPFILFVVVLLCSYFIVELLYSNRYLSKII